MVLLQFGCVNGYGSWLTTLVNQLTDIVAFCGTERPDEDSSPDDLRFVMAYCAEIAILASKRVEPAASKALWAALSESNTVTILRSAIGGKRPLPPRASMTDVPSRLGEGGCGMGLTGASLWFLCAVCCVWLCVLL